MRSLIFSLSAIAILSFTTLAGAQQLREGRSCIGSCDRYGSPELSDPVRDDHRYRRGGDNEFRDPYDEGYGDEGRGDEGYRNTSYDDGYYSRPRHRTVRRHHRKTRRTNRKRHYRSAPRYGHRTEFCRTRKEVRGHGWGRKKVNVKRCIWVRNDLLRNRGWN